ncbi:cold-shock protein [Aequorivita marina]|uniref:cold-shock protein n=1 Tax=Aequorivita marina TaxID=3073654 RepID=UPI002875769A|nr:cold shock domain-containing protein [Aequorivita sp. S2608]MDS1297760.1 cold shock domain-containing protein [Aequorivita sp. S2608]
MNTKKPEPRKEGTVKFFNVSKGYGFINIKGTDDDIFVHISNVIDKIREGDKVEFGIEQGEKGPSATEVKVV